MTPSDVLYIETKSLFVQILQLLPNTGPVSSLSNVAAEATKSGIKRLEHLGRRASYMLRELEELRVVDESALKTLMLDEVIAELVSLGNVHMQDKLKEDKESLLSVLEALKQHHTYLQGQFDTYQAYLQNVRLSSERSPIKRYEWRHWCVVLARSRAKRRQTAAHAASVYLRSVGAGQDHPRLDDSIEPTL